MRKWMLGLALMLFSAPAAASTVAEFQEICAMRERGYPPGVCIGFVSGIALTLDEQVRVVGGKNWRVTFPSKWTPKQGVQQFLYHAPGMVQTLPAGAALIAMWIVYYGTEVPPPVCATQTSW